MTPRTLTRPSWLPRMKSERRPGCACFSARESSSIFRQNAKRVAMGPPHGHALRSRVRGGTAEPRDPRGGGESHLRDGTALPSPPGPPSHRLCRVGEEAGGAGEAAPRRFGGGHASRPVVPLCSPGGRRCRGGVDLPRDGRRGLGAQDGGRHALPRGARGHGRGRAQALPRGEGVAARAVSRVQGGSHDLATGDRLSRQRTEGSDRVRIDPPRPGERVGRSRWPCFRWPAALRLRSPELSAPLAPPAAAASEGEELCHLAGEFDARKPREAAARVRAYVARGYSTPRMLDVLANYACRDATRANDGFNVLLADACTAEFLAAKAPAVPMALAKMIAASPKDQAAYESWTPLFTP